MRAIATAVLIAAFAFTTGASGATAQPYGYAAKRPIVGAACSNCPWGRVADLIKADMKPAGYDVQVCYNCSGIENPRIVSEARRPPKLRPDQSNLPTPPDGPVDFGVTNLHRVYWAYHGLYDYAKDGPRKNLRAIAFIEHPMYLAVAVKASSGITDLAQIRERKMPVKIMVDDNPFTNPVLAHYGITKAELESWGGQFVAGAPGKRDDFDVIIQNQAYLANSPEANVWYEVTQKNDLKFLQLPDPLLQQIATDLKMELVDMPGGMLRGADHPIHTVARSGQVVYARADMPDAFAFALAKALDKNRRAFIWNSMPMSYNPETAPHALDIPLHPGAARYYRSIKSIR